MLLFEILKTKYLYKREQVPQDYFILRNSFDFFNNNLGEKRGVFERWLESLKDKLELRSWKLEVKEILNSDSKIPH